MIDPPSYHTNGKVNEAQSTSPPVRGGVLLSDRAAPMDARATQQTIFPPDLAEITHRSLLYWMGWAEFGGQRLRRWLALLLIALCLLVALVHVPTAWAISVLTVVLLGAIFLLRPLYQRNHFVRFAAEVSPAAGDDGATNPARALAPADKVPVHASGTLSVNGKRRDFVWLPGFYRTFATREHALLCLCRDRRILGVGAPPEAEMGLWYAFWFGENTLTVTRGSVSVGGAWHPGIRLVYQPADKKSRFGQNTPAPDTIYLACQSIPDRDRIWCDMQIDLVTATDTAAARPSSQPSLTARNPNG